MRRGSGRPGGHGAGGGRGSRPRYHVEEWVLRLAEPPGIVRARVGVTSIARRVRLCVCHIGVVHIESCRDPEQTADILLKAAATQTSTAHC